MHMFCPASFVVSNVNGVSNEHPRGQLLYIVLHCSFLLPLFSTATFYALPAWSVAIL